MTIHPIKIAGRWKEGFALDYHVISSDYVGDDEFGRPRFDTKRSELGELLYRLKYQSEDSAIEEIVKTATEFVRCWDVQAEAIVPVPPTRVGRLRQPVVMLARALGSSLGLNVFENVVSKVKETPQLKDVDDYNKRLTLLDGAFRVDSSKVRGLRILLVDDLFRSGATMNAVSSALYEQGGAAEVYAFALTRTRRR